MPLKKVNITIQPALQPVKMTTTDPRAADIEALAAQLDAEFTAGDNARNASIPAAAKTLDTQFRADAARIAEGAAFLDSDQPFDHDAKSLRRGDFPALDKIATTGEDAAQFTKSILGGAIGFGVEQLSRGQYGVTKFLDSHAGAAKKTFVQALKDGLNEAISPKEKMSVSDVIKKNNPSFAAESPITTETVGLLGDVVLDPVTWLTGGAKGILVTVAGKEVALSRKGEKVFKGLAKNVIEARAASSAVSGPNQAGTLVARASLDRQMMSLIEKDPGLVDRGVYRFAGVPIIPTKAQNAIRDFTGVVTDKLAKTAPGRAVTEARILFDRNFQLSPEYVHNRTKLEGHKDAVKQRLDVTARKMFEDLEPEARERITKVGYSVDEMTALVAKDKAKTLGLEHVDLSSQELADIRSHFITKENLNPNEVAMYSRMLHDFQSVKQLEMEAGLLAGSRQNYFPRMYKMIQDPEKFQFVKNVLRDPTLKTKLNSSEARVHDLMSEAKAAGLDPEMDAMTLYVTRMLESGKALANADFKEKTLTMFGAETMAQLPRRIKDDIRFIGDSIYPGFIKEEAHKWVERYDRLQSIFKKAATVYKPNFGVRQAVANPLQAYAVQGLKAFKMLDPRVVTDVGAVMAIRDGILDPSHLSKIQIKSPLGQTYTGDDIMKIFDDFNVLRGTQIGDEKFTRNLEQELNRFQATSKVIGKDATNAAFMAGKAMNWTHWPAMIEDFSRASMVVNGLRIGHSPAAAASLADKALFNYSEGLSAMEKQLMRRIVPFYSYQRFAIPLFLKVAGTNPGRLATSAKLFQTAAQGASNLLGSFAKASNGETLTDSERKLTPDYIMEQPHTFQRFDEKMQAVYNTFNNFSLIDVLGTMELDEKGDIDVRRTVEKSVLGQLTPWLKIPLELAVDKGLFTDQAIKEMDRLGSLNHVGATMDRVLEPYLSENIKNAIGWEPGKTNVNGKPTIYVNPYLLYIAKSVYPILNEIVKDLNPELSPLEKVASTLFGVGTSKVDLQASRGVKLAKSVRKIKEKEADVLRFARQGRQKSFDKAYEQIQKMASDLILEQDELDRSSIRAAEPPPELPDFLTSDLPLEQEDAPPVQP